MKRAIFLVPFILAGCSTPIPFFGNSDGQSDGQSDVQIEAKLIIKSGQVLPVPNVHFSYRLYDSKLDPAKADETEPKQIGSFITDFDGKAKIHVTKGLLLVSGFYSILDGSSKVTWVNAPFYLPLDNPPLRLTNDNGTVTNN